MIRVKKFVTWISALSFLYHSDASFLISEWCPNDIAYVILQMHVHKCVIYVKFTEHIYKYDRAYNRYRRVFNWVYNNDNLKSTE